MTSSPPPSATAGAGGFILSPPASTTSSSANPTLPHPRDSPLRPGGPKESAFIRYVDQRLLHIQRRFAKRTSPQSQYLSDVDREKADSWGDVQGYTSMAEVCKDLEELIGVVWVSGTPTLQVPYLISIGLMTGNVVQAMPPKPKELFGLLGKMDYAFASLLRGEDVESGERLPGFVGGRGVSGTEKVRVRSLVERTRVSVVEAFKKGEFEYDTVDGKDDQSRMETDTEDEVVLEGDDHEPVREEEEEDESIDMQIGRVYDRTILELGDSLEQPNIGIITEGRG